MPASQRIYFSNVPTAYFSYWVTRDCWCCGRTLRMKTVKPKITSIGDFQGFTWSCQFCETTEIANPTGYNMIGRTGEPEDPDDGAE